MEWVNAGRIKALERELKLLREDYQRLQERDPLQPRSVEFHLAQEDITKIGKFLAPLRNLGNPPQPLARNIVAEIDRLRDSVVLADQRFERLNVDDKPIPYIGQLPTPAPAADAPALARSADAPALAR